MITKKFIQGAASVVTAGALLVGGTFAYFTDSDTSTGNTLGAGSLAIELQELDGTPKAGAAFFTATGMMPGDAPVAECGAVANVGTLDFEWTMEGTEPTPSTPTLSDVLWAKTYEWTGAGTPDCEATEGWTLVGGNIFPNGLPVSSVLGLETKQGLLAAGNTEYFKWEYWLPATVSDPQYQGAGASYDMTVKAYQTNDPAYDALP